MGGWPDDIHLPYDLKHPIVQPKCHFLTELITRNANEQGAGIVESMLYFKDIMSKVLDHKRQSCRAQGRYRMCNV